MPLNIGDAKESYVSALSDVNEWREEFMAQWYESEVDRVKVMLMQRINSTPGLKENLRRLAPDGMNKLEAKTRKVTNGMVG